MDTDNTTKKNDDATDESTSDAPQDNAAPLEIGGKEGHDPTQYGDWQHNGRCTDF